MMTDVAAATDDDDSDDDDDNDDDGATDYVGVSSTGVADLH